MRIPPLPLWAFAALIAAAAPAQVQTVITPSGLPGGNQNHGAMFDLRNAGAAAIAIEQIDVVFAQGGLVSVPLEIWAKAGPSAGSQSTPGAWTLVSQGVVPGPVSGPGVLQQTGLCLVGVPLLQIPPGATAGVYVTTQGGGPQLAYSTHSGSVGDVVTTDGTLEVRAGFGGTYPFGSQFAPRSFNGAIHYRAGGAQVPWVQVNTPRASLVVDGQTGTACQVAATSRCRNELFPMVLSSNLGPTIWDVIVQVGAPAVPGPVSPGGQVVNIDASANLGYWFSLGGAPPPPGSFPVSTLAWGAGQGSLTIPLVPPFALAAHAQAYWLDPGHADQISISAPAFVNIAATGGPATPVALGEDASVAVQLAPLCVPPVSYYGTSYSSLFINANGSVSFLQPSSDWTSSPGEFVTQMPRIAGMWTDLSPQAGGTVSYSTSPQGIAVSFAGVPQYNTANSNSFSIEMTSTGTTTISGYAPANPFQFAPVLVGFSPGAPATNPGALSPGIASFLGAGLQTSHLATDAIYGFDFFLPPAAGWNSFTLFGNGAAWQVQ